MVSLLYNIKKMAHLENRKKYLNLTNSQMTMTAHAYKFLGSNLAESSAQAYGFLKGAVAQYFLLHA